MAETAAFIFALLWLGTSLFWRWSVAAAGQSADEAAAQYLASVAAAEQTRDNYRRQMHAADQARADAVKFVEKLKDDNAALTKSNSDLSIECAALHVSLDKTSARLANVLKRLHDNLHAKKESPWRMLVGRLLREQTDV